MDIINQAMDDKTLVLTSVVYIEFWNNTSNPKNSFLINVNKHLLSNDNYYFCTNCSSNITPYVWENVTDKTLVADNNQQFDLSNFDNLRIALMNTYSAQTLAHVGYLITAIVALTSIFMALGKIEVRTFFSNGIKKWFLIILLTAIITLFPYFLFRLLFWSWLTDSVKAALPALAINQNPASILLGIQEYLTQHFEHMPAITTTPISGLSSAIYYIDQNWRGLYFPPSLALFLPITLTLSFLIINATVDWNKSGIQRILTSLHICWRSKLLRRHQFGRIAIVLGIFVIVLIIEIVISRHWLINYTSGLNGGQTNWLVIMLALDFLSINYLLSDIITSRFTKHNYRFFRSYVSMHFRRVFKKAGHLN